MKHLINTYCLLNLINEDRNIFQNDPYKHLIYEQVYFRDLFDSLIQYIRKKILLFQNDYVYLTGEKIKSLISQNWKGLKYFKSNKNLYIVDLNNIEKIPIILTNQQLETIRKNINIQGCFINDLTNIKNTAIIVMNESKVLYKEYSLYLFHQLIHYFQWNTGHSIHDFLKKKQIIISQKDQQSIKQIFHIQNPDQFINKLINKKQIETYVNTVFEALTLYSKKISKLYLKQLFYIFENTGFNDFKQYYLNVQKKKKQENFNLNISQLNYLYFLGYFKCGWNTFKNHIFSYFSNKYI